MYGKKTKLAELTDEELDRVEYIFHRLLDYEMDKWERILKCIEKEDAKGVKIR